MTRLQALKREWPTQTTDAILPIEPKFLNEIIQGTKKAEYRSYLMPKIKRLWFCPNKGPRKISIMAEVEPAETHKDLRTDGTPKQPY